MAKSIRQSVEPKIADIANGWLKEYNLDYKLEQESLNTEIDTALNEYFSKNGLQFSPDVELATTDMILPAVRYNMGIGFLPEEFAGDDLESGKVFEIDVNETLPERSIILIHDTEYPQSIASKAFQKFLAERKEQNR